MSASNPPPLIQACPENRLPRSCFNVLHGQAIRFLIAGGLATLVHWSVMAILVYQDMSPVRASTAGAIVGAVINYMLQFHWAFSARSHEKAAPAYACTLLLGWCANAATLAFFISVTQLDTRLGQACATATVAAMNFILYKKVVFHESVSR